MSVSICCITNIVIIPQQVQQETCFISWLHFVAFAGLILVSWTLGGEVVDPVDTMFTPPRSLGATPWDIQTPVLEIHSLEVRGRGWEWKIYASKTSKDAISERSSCSLTSFKVLLNRNLRGRLWFYWNFFFFLHLHKFSRTRTKKLGSKQGNKRNERAERRRSERLQEGGEKMSDEGKEGEMYANDKVWLAVGGIGCSGGNMCVGTNCRQEFIRLVVR